MKSTTKILIFVLLFFLICIIFPCFILSIPLAPPPLPTPQPISTELKNELCLGLDGMAREPICTTETVVLASETFPLFEKRFKINETTIDDVVNLLGTERIDEIDIFTLYSRFHQFDLAGTGVNRIVVWSNHENIIKSVVFIRQDELTPLHPDTVSDICKRLDLPMNASPCENRNITYAHDFFPFLQERLLGKPNSQQTFEPLAPYAYIEEPLSYKLVYKFRDNRGSQIIFYFDENKNLNNLAFFEIIAPTQIDAEVLTDLCHQLNLEPDNDKCKPNAEVYPEDFAEEIQAEFPIGIATYEDVQAKLGKYQFRFDYPVRDANGNADTLSWYDFVGNNFTRIRFDFDTDFVVNHITIFVGGS